MKIVGIILGVVLNVLKAAIEFFSGLLSRVSFSKSIRTKLIAAFLVPIAFIIVQGIISYSNTSGTVTKIAKDSTVATMDGESKYLNLVFSNIEDLTFQIIANKDINEYLSQEDLMTIDAYESLQLTTRVTQVITTAETTNKNIARMFLIANENKTLAPSGYSSSNTNLESVKDTEFFKKTVEANGTLILKGFHEEIDKINNINRTADGKNTSYALTAVRAVKSLYTGKTIGLLIIDVKYDFIQKMLNGINIGKNSMVYLVSPDGRELTKQIEGEEKTANSTKITDQKFYADIVASEEITGSYSVSFNNSNYLMSYSKIGKSGFVLIGLIPTAELNSGANQIVFTTILIIVIAVLLAFGIGIYMATGMSRTINSIIKAAGLAASGDLTVNLASRRRDELGILTKSINSMISNMRRLIEETSEISMKVANSALTATKTSEQVSSVSHEISRAIQEISQGVSAQASDAEMGVQKISELAGKINNVTENAKSIDSLTHNTMDMTKEGLASTENLDNKARETTMIAKEILTDIQELDKHSKSIGKIVKVISGIADQTNLLALNATIEAARAGEMGKGFAVVADEVRKLAEQSMNATREISSIIKDTQSQTSKAVEKAVSTEVILKSQNEAVLSTVNVFKNIKISMETLAGQVEQIMSGVVEMGENKEHAINSIENISAVSEETAASSEEVTASTQEQLSCIEELANFAQELGQAAKELENSIAMFKLI